MTKGLQPELAESMAKQSALLAAPGESSWPAGTMKSGAPIKNYANTREAILKLRLLTQYDLFRSRYLIGGRVLQQFHGELSDPAERRLRQLICDQYKFDPGKANTHEAVMELCDENRFHSIQDYLDTLKWDGEPRLDTWMTDYLDADDTPFVRAVGRSVLVAAVRRVRKPGTKFDYITVLEGDEGTGKSSAVRILAGDHFSDQSILLADEKVQMELVRGIWLYEIAELTGIRKADIEKVKSFASRTTDRARPAYGHHREDVPRQNIFIATTNDSRYLVSRTGNRRFWPILTGEIKLDELREDRDQLWAEAAIVEAKGESLELPVDLLDDAIEQQKERQEIDPWVDELRGIVGDVRRNVLHGADRWDEERVRSSVVFEKLHIPIPERTGSVNARIAACMRTLGYEKDCPKVLRFGPGDTARGYVRLTEPGTVKQVVP